MTQGKDAGGRRTASAWARLRAAMATTTPVNKGMSGEAASTRRLPQIDNPVLVGAAGLGALVVGAAVKTLRPGRRGGRDSRFRVLLARAALNGETGADALLAPDDVDVEVHEAFGKPPLVSVDVNLRADRVVDVLAIGEDGETGGGGPLEASAIATSQAEKGRDLLPRATLVDLLTRVVQAAWDNPEIAPVAVRGRVLIVAGGDGGTRDAHGDHAIEGTHHVVDAPGAQVLVDMGDLGFVDETARPADLFDKFGAPASDPSWRP